MRISDWSSDVCSSDLLDVKTFGWGSERYKRTGALMPEDGAEQLRNFDAIFFGAVGAPDVPDHLPLWGLRLAICPPLDPYSNGPPTRLLPATARPLSGVGPARPSGGIVHENPEGQHAGPGA